MIRRFVFLLYLAMVTCLVASGAGWAQDGSAGQIIKIGVLAARGTEECIRRWAPTAQYLSAQVSGYNFEIVPLSFDDLPSAVKADAVSFLICNTSLYVEVEDLYGATRLATLKYLISDKYYTVFGGVILCRSDRTDISSLQDLKGKSFMAADERSLGGWRAAWRELKENGINPEKDFSDLLFAGNHDTVVSAIASRRVDAGTISTHVLEQMSAEGKIDLRVLKVIHQQKHAEFPFLHSTRLYPEWPFAKLKNTSDRLSEKVAIALLSMVAESPAAQAADSAGWTVPMDYNAVDECLKILEVGPYKNAGVITFAAVFKQYRSWLITGFALVLLLNATIFYILGLNKRLQVSKRALEQEIVEREATQRALVAERDKAQKYLDIAGVILVALNDKGETTLINQMGCTVLGWKEKEILGKNWFDLSIPPEYRDKAKSFFERMIAGKKQLHDYYEGPVATKWGQMRFIVWHTILLRDEAGNTVGALSSGEDITKRKRAEEELQNSEARLRNIISSNSDGMIVVDKEGIIRFVNPAAEELLARKPEELMERHFGLPLVKGEATELDIPRSEGDTAVVEMRIVETDWENDTATLVSLRDITQRKRAEEERDKIEALLRQAQKMEAIGTLAGGIAHDFNNILSAILGYTEMAQDDMPVDRPVWKYLEQVLKAANRAKELVRQILTFSRQSEQTLKPVEIGYIIKEAIYLIRASLPSTIEIRLDVIKSSTLVLADPTQIHQVLMNLCTNAAHSMREKGGIMEVRLSEIVFEIDAAVHHPDLRLGPYLRLTVTDTGKGMSNEVMGRIFDPFFTTKEPGEGTGMGLSMVQGIVKGHGGAITVYSEVGKGTTINVYFPKIKAGVAEEIEISGPIEGGTERILFVDDEEALVLLGQRMLERLGYEVLAQTSGLKALEIFRADPNQFDIIITDQTMPHMTGAELAGEFLKIRADCPIILCSGFSELISPDDVLALGVRKYVMKPFSATDIARAIRDVMNVDPNKAKGS